LTKRAKSDRLLAGCVAFVIRIGFQPEDAMKSKCVGTLAIAAFAGMSLMGVHEVRADLLNLGTTYNNNGTDFATGGIGLLNNTIALSPSAQPFGGGTQITETTTPLSGGAEFVEFDISTIDGGPLVANLSMNSNEFLNPNEFLIYLNNIQLTAPAVSSNYYFDFATNGAANTGITPWSAIGVEANPNSGSSFAGKNAFYFPFFVPSNPATTTSYSQFQYPFDYSATQLNIDPNATGYIVGWELSPQAGEVGVPGPAAGAGLPGIVFATGGLLAWWRGKRTGASGRRVMSNSANGRTARW
jgi:hypothetical protein